MALLLNPVTLELSAKAPTAPLNDPLPSAVPSLLSNAAAPTPVFRLPNLLSSTAAVPQAVFASARSRTSAPAPTPVLKLPLPTLKSARQPSPVFAMPVVDNCSACCPSAVVNPGYPPSGGGTSARVCGANAKHTRMSGMRRNPRHNGSERAGSRPHETNLLTRFNEYMDVFFLFPGRVWIVFYLSLGSQ